MCQKKESPNSPLKRKFVTSRQYCLSWITSFQWRYSEKGVMTSNEHRTMSNTDENTKTLVTGGSFPISSSTIFAILHVCTETCETFFNSIYSCLVISANSLLSTSSTLGVMLLKTPGNLIITNPTTNSIKVFFQFSIDFRYMFHSIPILTL